jgi:hypothetical protein
MLLWNNDLGHHIINPAPLNVFHLLNAPMRRV